MITKLDSTINCKTLYGIDYRNYVHHDVSKELMHLTSNPPNINQCLLAGSQHDIDLVSIMFRLYSLLHDI